MKQPILMTVFLCAAAAASTAQNTTDRPVKQDQTPALKELSELQLHQQAWYQETFLKKHSLAIDYYVELIRRGKNRSYVWHSKWRLISLYSRTGRFGDLKKHMLSVAEMVKNRSDRDRRMVRRIIAAVDGIIQSKRFEKLSKEAREAYLHGGNNPRVQETRKEARKKLLAAVKELDIAFGRRGPETRSDEANAKRNKLLSRKRRLEEFLKAERRAGRGNGAKARAAQKELRTVWTELASTRGRRSNRSPRRGDRYTSLMLQRVESLRRDCERKGKSKDAAKLKGFQERLKDLLHRGRTDDARRLIREASKDFPALRPSRRSRRGREPLRDRKPQDRKRPRKRTGD